MEGEKGLEAVNLEKVLSEMKEEEEMPITQEPESRARMAPEVSNASEASDTSSDGDEQKKRRKASPIREGGTPRKQRADRGGRKEKNFKEEMNGIRIRVENLVVGAQKRKENTVKKTTVKEEQEERSSTRR